MPDLTDAELAEIEYRANFYRSEDNFRQILTDRTALIAALRSARQRIGELEAENADRLRQFNTAKDQRDVAEAENRRLRVLIDPDNEQAVRRVALWLSGWGDDEFENWERIRNPLVGRYLGDAKTVLRCLRDAANGEAGNE